MNRKDIIRVFMDADGHMNDFNGGIEISWDNLVKGAMQLIEAEREACAKVCDSLNEDWNHLYVESCADAIRARVNHD
jgi:hypothetical protein